MSHTLIVGMTESGKSTLAAQLSKAYHDRGIGVIVLDPLLDPRWQADLITADSNYFLSVVQHPDTRSCAIFIDECGEMIGHYQHEMFFVATRGRHMGHNCHFITQRAKQLSPTVRDQCSFLALFSCSYPDAHEMSLNFNRPELKQANILQKGDYFFCGRWGDLRRLKVNFFIDTQTTEVIA